MKQTAQNRSQGPQKNKKGPVHKRNSRPNRTSSRLTYRGSTAAEDAFCQHKTRPKAPSKASPDAVCCEGIHTVRTTFLSRVPQATHLIYSVYKISRVQKWQPSPTGKGSRRCRSRPRLPRCRRCTWELIDQSSHDPSAGRAVPDCGLELTVEVSSGGSFVDSERARGNIEQQPTQGGFTAGRWLGLL